MWSLEKLMDAPFATPDDVIPSPDPPPIAPLPVLLPSAGDLRTYHQVATPGLYHLQVNDTAGDGTCCRVSAIEAKQRSVWKMRSLLGAFLSFAVGSRILHCH